MDLKDILTIGGILGTNLAGFGIIAKYTVSSVVETNKTLPGLITTVAKIDQNQTNLFDRMRTVEGDVKHIEGVCEERGKKGGC